MNKKVVRHSVASVTKSGYSCERFPDSLIIVGNNPVGPRGGHCGQWADGKVLARYSFSDRMQKYVLSNLFWKVTNGFNKIGTLQ